MSQATSVRTPDVLTDYRRQARAQDEVLRLLDDPQTDAFTRSMGGLDAAGWQRRQRAIKRLVRAEGITYGGSLPGQLAKSWRVDAMPLLITGDEWARLHAGLAQRLTLLNLVLADLYGPRRLIHDRVLPGEIVFGHSGFLPTVDGIEINGAQLVVGATDLVRAPNGAWTVISDRTQSPSGMGYAMANRRLVSRVLDDAYRDAPIHRLRGFFDRLRTALEDSAPDGVTSPRSVILSPGPASETSYDQALLSTLIGHPVVQASDLEIDGGRLWLRTTGRREPIDVIARRVDAAWCDSLDLRADSRLGVPGMVQAARSHRVAIANPLGAGVLENQGLLAHLDRVAHYFLGAELLLPTVPTFWCGEPAGLQYTLANLDELVIKPIARGLNSGARPGWLLDAADRADLVARIKAEPWAWAAQEAITPSSAPVIGAANFEPRDLVLRTFGVAADDSYQLLPGGLARLAANPEQFAVTNAHGAISKDVWVLQDREALLRPIDLDERRARRRLDTQLLPGLPPSAAGNLYWFGRYAERAEATARILKISEQLLEDNLRRPDTPGHAAMASMLESVSMVTGVPGGFVGPGAAQRLADPLPHLTDLVLDARTRGTVAYNVDRTIQTASDVREVLSLDTFSVLNTLGKNLGDATEDDAEVQLQPLIADVLRGSLALAGLVNESLVRDAVWAFVEVGRRMERAQTTVRMLRHTIARQATPVAEALLTESVLSAGDSVLTYRRRMAAGVGASVPAEAGLELLLLDPTNPRSVVYQLDRMVEAMQYAPNAGIDRDTAALADRVRRATPDDLFDGERLGVQRLLDALDAKLRELSDQIEAVHFAAPPTSIAFTVPEAGEQR